MNWSDVIADPSLQDLPYKIELNQHGAVVMTPASNRHGRIQVAIAHELIGVSSTRNVIVECSVKTSKGVKVADVAWMSDDFVSQHGETTPFAQAPELCIEVVSPSNARVEMEEKVQLYLQQGAREVWLCSESGQLEFFSAEGALERSVMFPEFPLTIG